MRVNSKGNPLTQRPRPIGVVASGLGARTSAAEIIQDNRAGSAGRVARGKQDAAQRTYVRDIVAKKRMGGGDSRRSSVSASPRTARNVPNAQQFETLNNELQVLKLQEKETLSVIEALTMSLQVMPSWKEDVDLQIADLNAEIATVRIKINESEAKIQKPR
jgi:hypothetical protein